MILTANDTMPTVEMRGAAESRQVYIEFELQHTENDVRDFAVEGARWHGYRAM